MAFEIEHKYLVNDTSFHEMSVRSTRLVQGYLSRVPERTVRIRISGDDAFLTVKGRNEGDTRLEFEYPVPKEDALLMLGMCQEGIIDKTRYIVPFEGFNWEVDEFHGKLQGLVTAEIELQSSHTRYKLPPFVGKNITGDPQYYNSNLLSREL